MNKFEIHHFRELPSTNDFAREQAARGAKEGAVYVADYQTNGRGQFDRKWKSPAGKNLLFSLLIRPPLSPARAPRITQIVCRSVAAVLGAKYQMKCAIKKPNDVTVQGKKICGILVESSSASPKKVDSVIIGVGLNVNQAPKGVTPEAIAMRDILGNDLDLEKVLKDILDQLEIDLKPLYARPVPVGNGPGGTGPGGNGTNAHPA